MLLPSRNSRKLLNELASVGCDATTRLEKTSSTGDVTRNNIDVLGEKKEKRIR